MKNSTKLKAGLLLTSLACAAGATAALVLLQKKREEEVYHEAELKAMDELEEMMRSESDCASCACAEECPAPETYAAAKNDAAAAETPAEPPEEESDGKPDIDALFAFIVAASDRDLNDQAVRLGRRTEYAALIFKHSVSS